MIRNLVVLAAVAFSSSSVWAARPLTITTLPFDEPSHQAAVFDLLSADLSRLLGEPVRFEAGTSYREVIDRLARGQTDVAFLGGLAYLEARKKGGAKAILRAVRDGRGTYRGVVVVATASSIKSLEELAGRTVAFVDPHSTAGYLFAAELLRGAGLDPKEGIEAEFLGSHHEVVEAVSARKADAGAIFEGGERLLADPSSVRVVATTEDLPGDPVVVRPGLGAKRVAKLRSALMEIATSPRARPFFEFSGIDSLVPANDGDYEAFAKRVKQLKR